MTQSIFDLSVVAYTFLLPLAWIGVAILIVIFLPISFMQGTKSFAGKGIFTMSYLFGVTTWLLSCIITFATWGVAGLIIGLFFLGVGVVPMAILASFIMLKSLSMGLSIIVMAALTFGTRLYGIYLLSEN